MSTLDEVEDGTMYIFSTILGLIKIWRGMVSLIFEWLFLESIS